MRFVRRGAAASRRCAVGVACGVQRRRAVPAVRVRRRDLPVARRIGDGLREQLARRRSTRCAARRSTPARRRAIDRDAVRDYYTTPVTRVTPRRRTSRRSNRRFVHVRLDVDDMRRLGEAAPFAWSTYQFDARRRPVRLPADGRRGGAAKAGRRRRLERQRDRGVPPAPAEQDRLPQRRTATIRSAATSSSGSSRSPIGCAARRSTLEARMETQSILYTHAVAVRRDVRRPSP